jgi:hypothetical protein
MVNIEGKTAGLRSFEGLIFRTILIILVCCHGPTPMSFTPFMLLLYYWSVGYFQYTTKERKKCYLKMHFYYELQEVKALDGHYIGFSEAVWERVG